MEFIIPLISDKLITEFVEIDIHIKKELDSKFLDYFVFGVNENKYEDIGMKISSELLIDFI
jgi:hypothetical protein